MRTPTFEKTISDFFSFSFSAVFVGNSATPMSTLANNKRSYCSKNLRKKSGRQNCAFFLFFGRKNGHDFVSLFTTFANIKGSLPTKSTITPDRLQCRTKTDGEDFPAGFCGHFIFRTS